jgi:hypothetical protein
MKQMWLTVTGMWAAFSLAVYFDFALWTVVVFFAIVGMWARAAVAQWRVIRARKR